MEFDDDVAVAPQTVVPRVDSRERASLEEIVARLSPEEREVVRDFALVLLSRRAARLDPGEVSRADPIARDSVSSRE